MTAPPSTGAHDALPPLDRSRPFGQAANAALGRAVRYADVLTAAPGYPTAVHALIRWETVTAALAARNLGLASRLVGSTTRAQERSRREHTARLALRGGAAGPNDPSRGREPPVFWHEGGAGPTVLLLNGWTASGLAWPVEWLRQLEERHRVLRIDNRGTGWSRTAPAPFTIGDMATDAASVLRATGGEPATVLGLSMGGMVAQELAIRHPELVSRLVLVGTRPPAPAYLPAAPHVLERELRQLLDTPRHPAALATYFRSVWEPQSAPGFAHYHPELFDELAAQLVERVTPRAAVIHQLRAIAAWTGAPRLRRIGAPTVIVHGVLDELIPVGNGMRLARQIPGAAYVELSGVGHLVHLEAPDALTEAIGGGS